MTIKGKHYKEKIHRSSVFFQKQLSASKWNSDILRKFCSLLFPSAFELRTCIKAFYLEFQNALDQLRYTQNFRAKWPSVSWVWFASLSCGLQIFCHFTVKMVETTLIFSAAKTSFDPQVQGCLIIGKPRNLQTVTFDNLAEKLSPRVDAAVRHFFLFYSIKIYVYNNWFYFQFE